MTKTGDTSDGTCSITDCSLREAIAAAASGDTVSVPAGVYTLTRVSELSIGKNLTVQGAGSGDTIIQADEQLSISTRRVLDITAGKVSISGVTIRHGNPPGLGGGILNSGTLSLADTTLTANQAGATDGGGGIFSSGTMTITGSRITGNIAPSGAGISSNGPLSITNSTIQGNTASSYGGGIFNDINGALTLSGSTISGNTAGDSGAGIRIVGGTVTVTNSTISGNSAGDHGGAIWNAGTLAVKSTTLTNNTAVTASGGIRNFGTADLVNTILAKNAAPAGPDCTDDFGGMTSLGHNLIGTADGCSFTPAAGDKTNVDPNLGPLADNGGPTKTHALLPGSPAIDAGDDSKAPDKDQRGVARPQDGDNDGSARSDIGAFELVPTGDTPQTSPITVTKTGDTSDGFCGTLDCSLREAIVAAASGDKVQVPAGTYTLALGSELTISKSLTVEGSSSGDTIIQAGLTSADATSRVFNITGSGGQVTLSWMRIRHGNDERGGGILNDGALSVNHSSINENTVTLAGGGIYNRGVLAITSSTVSNNIAGTSGGGIFHWEGTLTLKNITVSTNRALLFESGGIFSNATLSLTNSTITQNRAAGTGGLRKQSGTVTLTNTIIAGNTGTQPDCAGSLTSLGHNLIGDITGCNFNSASGDLVSKDPNLGPPDDNGAGLDDAGVTITLVNTIVAGQLHSRCRGPSGPLNEPHRPQARPAGRQRRPHEDPRPADRQPGDRCR